MHAGHRERLLDSLDDAVVFVPAATLIHRNSDTEFEFYQDSSFFYLTGLDESDAIAVLSRKGSRRRFTLYVRPKDALDELWNGTRIGPVGARRTLGADAAYPLASFEKHVGKHIEGHGTVVLPLGAGWAWEKAILESVSRFQAFGSRKGTPATVRDLRSAIGPVRRKKTADEIRKIRDAVATTEAAFAEVMACVRPGMGEDQVRAVIDLVYGAHGGTWAFPTIAAGGANACVLHYARGRDVLRDGDLLLLDAGADRHHYCADITRTMPVSGRFGPSQKRLYGVVLRALEAATAKACPGNRIEDVHNAAVESIAEGLLRVGLLKGRTKTIVSKKRYRTYFPHGTAHWLGLDVHDVGAYSSHAGSTVLEAGDVITVEPGIYVQPTDRKAPPRFRGMGIRIEDDVLVTEKGPVVLSAAIPRTIDEIEAAMARRARFVRKVPSRRRT